MVEMCDDQFVYRSVVVWMQDKVIFQTFLLNISMRCTALLVFSLRTLPDFTRQTT